MPSKAVMPMDYPREIAGSCLTITSAAEIAAEHSILPWFAIRVRSNAERSVSLALTGKGYEQYLPLYTKHNRWTDRIKKLDLPLFPGYVFCRLDVALRRPVLIIPGVINVVGFGNQFVAVPDEQIQAVQNIIRSGLPSVPWPFLREGDRIRVRTGSLEGIEGFLVQIKNEYRVVVSVPLLQRSVAVEIDRDWIQPLPAAASLPAGNSGLSSVRAR